MKIQSVASPNDIRQAPSPDLKARAVAAFNQANQQPAAQVVQNQNSISAEEMGAIIPQSSQQVDKVADIEETVETAEAPSEEVPKAESKPKEDPALSRQFAQLARQERALRAKAAQQDQALKAREAAIQAREAEISSKSQQYQDGYISKDRLLRDTLGTLAEAGINYEEITRQAMNQTARDPRMEAMVDELKAEIKTLKQANETSQKTYNEQQQQAYQAAVKQIRQDAVSLVKADPIAYEAIAKTGSVKDVVDLITQTYDKDGVLLTVEEAAQEVENYLIDQGVNTLGRIDKIKKKLGMNASSSAQKTQTPSPTKQTQPMKTLTNATSSTRPLSARERAILAFGNKLKP